MTRRWTRLLGPVLLIALGAFRTGSPTRTAYAADHKPRIWLARAVPHDAYFRGASLDHASALSLATEDFDGDGIGDLAAGYATPSGGRVAIFRGNLDAFAPQSDASFWGIARNEFPSPYLPEAQVVPQEPQLSGSDWRSTHAPSPQRVCPGTQGH